MKTTLNQIRTHSPCADGWKKLLAHLGKTQADDEPLGIVAVLDSNDLDDALWCLRAVEGHDRELRLYAVWCARQVQYLTADQRSITALDVAERHANGMATDTELAAARSAAWSAARSAAGTVAGSAAWAAAVDAARSAAGTAAGSAAWAAAGAAAWGAARSAARSAAVDAARAAAWSSAWGAARAAQEKELRRICAAIDAAEVPEELT